jgi:hypothetical protein
MFRSLRFVEAFEHLATPEEWSWFGPMAGRRVMHIGVDGWPLFPFHRMQAYPVLWRKLSGLALDKLRGGEWLAQGISARYGPCPQPIDTNLWDYLQLVDRVEEAKGAGFHFIALTVSSVEPPKLIAPHKDQPLLRRQLTEWIRAHSDASKPPLLRAALLAMAREAFPGCVITDNMYRDCRREAGLPEEAVQRGRPKTKGSDF